MQNHMNKVLIDSDFLVGMIREDEDLHEEIKEMVNSEWFDKSYILVTSLVKMESVTVISNRVGMAVARKLADYIDDLVDEEIFIDEEWMKLGWNLFMTQTKKGSSFIDSMNLVVAKKLGCKKILSFDKFYHKELRV